MVADAQVWGVSPLPLGALNYIMVFTLAEVWMSASHTNNVEDGKGSRRTQKGT